MAAGPVDPQNRAPVVPDDDDLSVHPDGHEQLIEVLVMIDVAVTARPGVR